MDILLIIVIAFLVSILFSLLGLGGAIIYTPLFFWLGFDLLTAIPMALFLNMITTASASITYLKEELVDKKVAYPLISTSIVGALFGSYLANKVEARVIILFLCAILLIASIRIIFFNNIGIRVKQKGNKRIIAGAGFALLIGAISSFIGVGGGTFIVPLLLILGFEMKNAVATSAFIITFISLSGFIGHAGFGTQTLDPGILFYSGIAVFVGAQLGSKIIFKRVSSKNISNIFAIVLLLVAGKLLYGLL
ncbi:MAG: sulfite exporter TauE/SafE family protein [Candidatus Methanoperedens sp.]|nr:sulfite exporter TauE/SafE family protein [Candidatus Methanoperedens sp.]